MDAKKTAIRALSGAVYIAIIVGLVCLGCYGVSLLALLLVAAATVEFDSISLYPEKKKPALVVCDVLANISIVLIPLYWFGLIGWIGFTFFRFLLELYSREKHTLRSLATSLMSQIYLGVPMLSMVMLAQKQGFYEPENFYLDRAVLTMFILIWVNDTGAFLTGSLFGRRKLFERVSPKKTWEGYFGGMLFTIGASALLSVIFGGVAGGVYYPMADWLVYGALVTIFATWGDLAESLIKRSLGIKDSGNIMPGHGGILDRIDSLLFVAPMTLLAVYFVSLF